MYPRLLVFAARWLRICKLGGTADDQVQRAVEALYAGASWPESVALERWFCVRIRQQCTTARRHERSFPKTDEAPLALLAGSTVDHELRDRATRIVDWLTADARARDDVASESIVRAMASGLLESDEIRTATSLDERAYRAARMRVSRSLARLPEELR